MKVKFENKNVNAVPNVGEVVSFTDSFYLDKVYIRMDDEQGRKAKGFSFEECKDKIFLLSLNTGEIVWDWIGNLSRVLVEPLEVKDGEIIFVEKK